MASINVKLLGDSTSLERSFKRAGIAGAGFNRNMGQANRVSTKSQSVMRSAGRSVAILGGGYLGAAGLVGAVRASWQEMVQSAKVTAQTNAVLKSTGGVANVTAKRVDALAASLLAKSGIDDETIRTGENMLLTFRGIRNEAGKGNNIFDQAAAAILDMDVAMTHGNVTQESLAKSAIRVGKALQDPIKGATALRRVGVQFTTAQEAQIKALVKSGNVMAAQKLILRELNTEFGGSATALGTTLPGKVNIAKESLRNLGGTMATQLAPAVGQVADRLSKFLSNTKNQKAIVDGFKTALAATSVVLTTVKFLFQGLARAVGGNRNAIITLIGVFALFRTVKMAATVLGIARSFGILTAKTVASTAATNVATASNARFTTSLVGKGGLVIGAGVAAFAITSLILKMTGLDKKLKSAGGAAFDLAAKLGLVNDPMKQFEGKRVPTQALAKQLQRRALTLHKKGLSDVQVQQRIGRENPNVAKRDIGILLARFLARQPDVHVHTTTNLDGKAVAKNTTTHQQRASKRRATSRRGPHTGR